MIKTRVVNATEFKAKCLALIDEVQERGGTITITRRGRAVAVLKPATATVRKSPANSWAGRMKIVGDIVNTDGLWEVPDVTPEGQS